MDKQHCLEGCGSPAELDHSEGKRVNSLKLFHTPFHPLLFTIVSLAHNPKSQYNLALFITDSIALVGTLSLRNCERIVRLRKNDRFLSQFRRLKVLLVEFLSILSHYLHELWVCGASAPFQTVLSIHPDPKVIQYSLF